MHNCRWCTWWALVCAAWSSAGMGPDQNPKPLQVTIIADATVPPTACRVDRPPDPCPYNPDRINEFVRANVYIAERDYSDHALFPLGQVTFSVVPTGGFVMRLRWPEVRWCKYIDLLMECEPCPKDKPPAHLSVMADDTAPGCARSSAVSITVLDEGAEGVMNLSALMPFLRILVRRDSYGDINFKTDLFWFRGLLIHVTKCERTPYFENADPVDAPADDAFARSVAAYRDFVAALQAFVLRPRKALSPIPPMTPHEKIKPFK